MPLRGVVAAVLGVLGRLGQGRGRRMTLWCWSDASVAKRLKSKDWLTRGMVIVGVDGSVNETHILRGELDVHALPFSRPSFSHLKLHPSRAPLAPTTSVDPQYRCLRRTEALRLL